MAMTPRLELRQSQSLVMTPQLQQAIKLLQLNNIELSAYVEQELERNPLLESPEVNEVDSRERTRDRDDGFGDEPVPEMSISTEKPSQGEAEAAMDVRYEDVHGEDSASDRGATSDSGSTAVDVGGGSLGQMGSGGSSRFDDMDFSLENTLSNELSLRDHLSEQLNLAGLNQTTRAVAQAIIDSIDPDGYFRDDAEEMAVRLGCSVEDVDQALTAIQGMEPTGIGARSLQECLKLQLVDQDRFDPAMEALIDRLEMLGKQDYQGLMRAIWGALNELPVEALVNEGRVYGGGLHKLEPRELARVSLAALQVELD